MGRCHTLFVHGGNPIQSVTSNSLKFVYIFFVCFSIVFEILFVIYIYFFINNCLSCPVSRWDANSILIPKPGAIIIPTFETIWLMHQKINLVHAPVGGTDEKRSVRTIARQNHIHATSPATSPSSRPTRYGWRPPTNSEPQHLTSSTWIS